RHCSPSSAPARTRPATTAPPASPWTPHRRYRYWSSTAPPPAHRHPPPHRRQWPSRSEEHTSELQSRENLVCRLLLEKKNIHLKHVYKYGYGRVNALEKSEIEEDNN